MNDLHRMLREAAENDDHWSLDPQELLSLGKKKVARRLRTVAGIVAGAALVAGIVVATGPLRGDDNAQVVNDPVEDGVYQAVEVPKAEVEERCYAVAEALQMSPETFVPDVDGGSAREGDTLPMVPENHNGDGDVFSTGDCIVPEKDMIGGIAAAHAEPPPAPHDMEAVNSLCSRRAGFDLSGWQVMASAGIDGRAVSAILLSANGYVASCGLTRDWYDFGFSVSPAPFFDKKGEADGALGSRNLLTTDCTQEPTCVSVGMVRGATDGLRVEVAVGNTIVGRSDLNRGAFAIEWQRRSSADPEIRVHDHEGTVLWHGPAFELTNQPVP